MYLHAVKIPLHISPLLLRIRKTYRTIYIYISIVNKSPENIANFKYLGILK